MLPEFFLDIKDYSSSNFHCAFCDCAVNVVKALLIRVIGSLPKKKKRKSFKIYPSEKNMET